MKKLITTYVVLFVLCLITAQEPEYKQVFIKAASNFMKEYCIADIGNHQQWSMFTISTTAITATSLFKDTNFVASYPQISIRVKSYRISAPDSICNMFKYTTMCEFVSDYECKYAASISTERLIERYLILRFVPQYISLAISIVV